MNRAAHRTGAGLAIGVIAAILEAQRVQSAGCQIPGPSEKPEFNMAKVGSASVLAAFLGTLPDVLEPATSPNHRQFFHSLAFAAMVGWGLHELWQWEPDEEWQGWLKSGLLVAGGAYLVHLAMDATTDKSLPLLGIR